jgi:Protein of unknown function (DUF3096)
MSLCLASGICAICCTTNISEREFPTGTPSPLPTSRRSSPSSPAILILIVPRLLSFIVAIYLIIVGLIGLNAIHLFIR